MRACGSSVGLFTETNAARKNRSGFGPRPKRQRRFRFPSGKARNAIRRGQNSWVAPSWNDRVAIPPGATRLDVNLPATSCRTQAGRDGMFFPILAIFSENRSATMGPTTTYGQANRGFSADSPNIPYFGSSIGWGYSGRTCIVDPIETIDKDAASPTQW